MKSYVVALALCLLCAAGLVSCEQSLVSPERKAPFTFPYDELNGHVYLSYVDYGTGQLIPNAPKIVPMGFWADADNEAGKLIEARDMTFLRQDNQLWLAEYVLQNGSVYFRYDLLEPELETLVPDEMLYEGMPVGVTGNDSIHALLLRTDSSGQHLEVVWLIHDLSQGKTYPQQVMLLPESYPGIEQFLYERISKSVVFPGGQKLLLKTDYRHLICDGTTAQEITLEGEKPFLQYALSIDPTGRTLAYTHVDPVPAGGQYTAYLHLRDLRTGVEVKHKMAGDTLFYASAWAPGGEPRLLITAGDGLLDVNTQTGEQQRRMTLNAGPDEMVFYEDLYWNP